VNKKRLLKLADMLEADAKNPEGIRFDLGTWGMIYDRAKPASCGTTACAMGFAAISGQFERAGLAYHYASMVFLFHFKGKNMNGYEAAQNLFSINYDTATRLFSPTAYPNSQIEGAEGERAVARRIRKLCAHS